MEFNLTETELTDYIKSAQGMIKYCIEKAAKHAPIRRIADNIEKVFPQYFHTYKGTEDTTVFLRCKTIEEMTPIIKYITLVAGLHQVGEKVQTGLSIEWKFEGSLSIKTEFSGKCKMVQTGEETITRPIFEMKCDEEKVNADEMPF